MKRIIQDAIFGTVLFILGAVAGVVIEHAVVRADETSGPHYVVIWKYYQPRQTMDLVIAPGGFIVPDTAPPEPEYAAELLPDLAGVKRKLESLSLSGHTWDVVGAWRLTDKTKLRLDHEEVKVPEQRVIEERTEHRWEVLAP